MRPEPGSTLDIRGVLRNVAIASSLLAVTTLLLGMLGRFFWLLDLFAHFRVHYIVVLAFSGVVLIGIRDYRSGIVALLASTLAAIPTFDYLLPAAQAGVHSDRTLRLLSMNIWFRNDDPARLIDYLEQSGSDLILLQEISEQQAAALHPHLKSYPHAYLGSASLTDTVLFSRWPLLETSAQKLSLDGVSALRAVVNWENAPITIVGAHLHWPVGGRNSAKRNAELSGLAELARTQRGPLVIAGDFNVTPWSTHFTSLLQSSGLNDCAAGHGIDPTWPSQVLFLGIRIDHCLASAHWHAIDATTGPPLGSDHRAIVSEMALVE